MDIVGPFPKCGARYQFILVIMDYATWFLDAIPLMSVTVPKVPAELIKWVAWVGLPKDIITYQGTNFMLGILKGFYKTLQISHLRMSVYHL